MPAQFDLSKGYFNQVDDEGLPRIGREFGFVDTSVMLRWQDEIVIK